VNNGIARGKDKHMPNFNILSKMAFPKTYSHSDEPLSVSWPTFDV
jgi:hypothetical protein